MKAAALALLVAAATTAAAGEGGDVAPRSFFRDGDKVVLVGNAFAERLSLHGRFEAQVRSRLPDARLAFRNFGWSGDTPKLMPRPLNFGDLHTHLERERATAVLLFFGMNESFEGEKGLAQFVADLDALVTEIAARRYDGEAPPRIALVSPIPHEDTRRSGLPDGAAHNRALEAYARAMEELAERRSIFFADLFSPLRTTTSSSPRGPDLTINGIHLGDYGDWVAASVLADAFLVPPSSASLVVDVERQWAVGAGASVVDAEFSDAAVTVAIEMSGLPAAPPPPGAEPGDALLDDMPRVLVLGLPPGRYEIAIDGLACATASAEELSRGFFLTGGPLFDGIERLRAAIVEKDRQFFYRHRAVNGEYVYGRRKEPFGVVNFPGEMKALDEIVSRADAEIARLARASSTFDVTIRPSPPPGDAR